MPLNLESFHPVALRILLMGLAFQSVALMCNGQPRHTVTVTLPAPARQKEVFEEFREEPGVKNGRYSRYRYRKLIEEGFYTNGMKDSSWTFYSRKKQRMAEGNYRQDKRDGIWQFYTYDGTLVQRYDYDHDSLVYFNLDAERTIGHAPQVWPDTAGEQLPLFIGGTAWMNTCIENNMVYPKGAWDKSKNARVVLSFTVDTLGQTGQVKCLQCPGEGFNEEGIRLVASLGKAWIPGRQSGRRVNVLFSIPISFVVE